VFECGECGCVIKPGSPVFLMLDRFFCTSMCRLIFIARRVEDDITSPTGIVAIAHPSLGA
jgi:hypothetical protein